MTPQQSQVLIETICQSLRKLIDTADDIEYARGYLKSLLEHVDAAKARWEIVHHTDA